MNDENLQREEQGEIDLRAVFAFLLTKIWIIIAAVLICAIGAVVYTKMILTPKYRSTAKVLVFYESNADGLVSSTDWNNSGNIVRAASELVTDDGLTANVTATVQAAYPEMTKKAIFDALTVKSTVESTTVSFSVATADPELSQLIAQSVADEFIKLLPKLYGEKVRPNIINDSVTPKAPFNVSLTKNVVIFALVGAVLSCGVLFVIFLLDDKIKNAADAEKYLGVSVLGLIPDEPDDHRKGGDAQ